MSNKVKCYIERDERSSYISKYCNLSSCTKRQQWNINSNYVLRNSGKIFLDLVLFHVSSQNINIKTRRFFCGKQTITIKLRLKNKK